jgi:hypothetical protein
MGRLQGLTRQFIMDIYLLRQGEQTGPFSEDAAQSLLKSGEATLDDFAWRDGLPTWQPLSAVLYPKSATQKILPLPPADAPTPTPEPFLSPVAAKAESATAVQKALLTYLGITFSGDITRERAATLIHEAATDPKHAARLKRWETEKLRLHPDLFADEIKERKESRPQHFLRVCETEGAGFFHDVTKAHAQVLVGYLDVQHPNWDEHPDASRYFFAAIAEKFPQLVKSGAKGQLKFPEGPKAAATMERSGLAVRSRKKRSPVAAAFRGVGLGMLVLAALYGVGAFYDRHIAPGLNPGTSQVVQGDMPLQLPATPSPITVARSDEPSAPSVAKTEPIAEAISAVSAPTPGPVVTAVAAAEPAPTAPPEPTATPAPEAPPTVAMPASPSPAPIATLPEAPPAVPMDTSVTPVPPAIPLFEPTATPAPATPAPRTSVKITKATPVLLRFGSSTLATGTVVPVVNVEGPNVFVRFGPDVIPVPVANTDLLSELPPK